MERRPVAAAGEAPPRQLPPGFRFHPTDEELIVQYLRRKVLERPLPAAVIPVVNAATMPDPWDLPGACRHSCTNAASMFFRVNKLVFNFVAFDCCRRERRRGGILLQPAATAVERWRRAAEESGQRVLEGHGEGEAGVRAAAAGPAWARRQWQASARRRQDGARLPPRQGEVPDRLGHARVPSRRRGH
jgi:hypothetical protein